MTGDGRRRKRDKERRGRRSALSGSARTAIFNYHRACASERAEPRADEYEMTARFFKLDRRRTKCRLNFHFD